ncbi:hypothetical protein BMR03_16315 [Methylococcaceae bacterium HT2]|nr:hypothetical protein BMR03_16315 [Methylococcaceae bacterium HT2]
MGVKELSDQSKKKPALEAGRDYPRIYREFVEWFPDNESCINYLVKLRWPNGFSCPECNIVSEPWYQTRGRMVCPKCRHQTSVTRGTIFDKTRPPPLQLGLRLPGI